MKKEKSLEKNTQKDRRCEVSSGNFNGFEIRGRLWIEGKKGSFLGYGRVVLLERIKKYGSISKAAKSMNMSYKRAWDLVESMNKQAKEPLVITFTGGKGGGGAKLTQAGERAIQNFWRLCERFEDFLKREIENLTF